MWLSYVGFLLDCYLQGCCFDLKVFRELCSLAKVIRNKIHVVLMFEGSEIKLQSTPKVCKLFTLFKHITQSV